MPRRPLADPPVEVSVSIPTTLLDKIDLLLFDPVRGRVRYGARSKLIQQLLKRWVDERIGAQAQDQSKPQSNGAETHDKR